MSGEIRSRINQEWSQSNDEKRYKWIYNKLKQNLKGFNYDLKDYALKMDKPTLLNFINSLDVGPSSREAMLFTISKYLQLNDPKNPNIILFQKSGHKLLNESKERQAKKNNN